MANIQKSGNEVISLIFIMFFAGVLANNLANQNGSLGAYNWIAENQTIIGTVFLILILLILKNVFGTK